MSTKKPVIAMMTYPYPEEYVVMVVRLATEFPFDKQERRFYKYKYTTSHINTVVERTKFMYGFIQYRYIEKFRSTEIAR